MMTNSGGGGNSTSYGIGNIDREKFDAEVWLLDKNNGIGGTGGKPWLCLGVIPQIHPTKNVWLRPR